MDEMDVIRRRRRFSATLLLALILTGAALYNELSTRPSVPATVQSVHTELAVKALEKLQIKGRAPKTGYTRAQFGSGWADIDGCDTRNIVLKRDLDGETLDGNSCIVLSGILRDPYTDKVIQFRRGNASSSLVQIDHVVALSDAWQKGAQALAATRREEFANDPLNLLAVDGPTNVEKGGSDAASWLPPNKAYRCRYIARQLAVKIKYALWATQAEVDAMKSVLYSCPDQQLPVTK